MSKPPRTANSGTFFISTITHDRRRLFQRETNARLLMDTLNHYRLEGLYKLFAFVIMPDHIHLLLTTSDLSKAMQSIKGGFSRGLSSSFPVWQTGYTDHLILDKAQFESRRLYIHENPVRARLVTKELFPYSSAFRVGVQKDEG